MLITSRRRLTALEDAAVISIGTLSPGEAVALLARLAGRTDLTTGNTAAEITQVCGYLPLAIGMLARQLKHHPARGGTELARELAAAHDRLAVMRTENVSVAAAFDLSYQDLTAPQRRLFRLLGLGPGADIDAYAAAALDDVSLETARALLDELYDQHLLSEPAPGRYLLHDLLREHARTLSAADDPTSSRAAIFRLVNYYAHVAAAASRHIATWTTAGDRPPPSDAPAFAPDLPDPDEAAGWLEAERPNLHAVVGYAATEGMPRHAVAIATAMGGFLRARGHWDQASDQYRTALAAAVQAADRPGEAGALDELGLLQQITGNYSAASATLAEAVALYRELGDLPGQVYALNHLGLVQTDVSDYAAAEASHRQALALARGAGDQLAEAVSLTDLGQVQQMIGEYAAAGANHERALVMFRSLGSRFDEADALCQLGFVAWLLDDQETAVARHREALALFRGLGDRLGQAWALDGLGLAAMATGDYPASAASLRQALRLHRELGARHGEAVALNCLGQLSRQASAPEEALGYHRQALAIARDLGSPLEEARALEGIGLCLPGDDTAEAAASLRQALAIYQRIGGPGERQLRDTLDRRGL